jgi:hypothetical protein
MDKRGLYFEELLTDKTYYTLRRTITEADRGIVTFSHRVINQDNTLVMDYKIKRMLRRKT